MKKLCLTMFVVTLCVCGTAMAVPDQNGEFNVPEIGSITVDGNLADWTYSTPWSEPFIFWAGTSTSTTKAKFAWNDADDLLYVGIQTDQTNGGHAAVGVGIATTTDPRTAVGATQLAFDAGSGTSVSIMNEIQYYSDTYDLGWADSGTDGVVAAQTNIGGVWTYEIAIPYWTSWTTMDVKQPISIDDVYYTYIVMEDELEGGNGTNLTYDGNPAFFSGNFEEGAALTFKGVPIPGDANGDWIVDDLDAAVLASNWQMQSGAVWTDGDFNNDHAVNDIDATLLATNWTVSTAAAPEPGTTTLLLSVIGSVFLAFYRQKR